jgi:Bacterial membrane protein YfhO
MRSETSTTKLSRWEPRIAVGFLIALVLGAFWKLTLMRGVIITDDVFASDLMNENFPYRFALGKALHAGEWPLWVREVYGGFPLLARSEAGVCYPFNIVLFGLLPPFVALNITILLTLLTAGIGMYCYARTLEAPPVAALLAGVAFCFSGYLSSHLKHLSMANAACWLPIGLASLERAVVRASPRPLLWFAVVFGLQHLSGNAQTAYYCGVLYLLYFPLRLLNQSGVGRPFAAAGGGWQRVLHVLRSKLTWAFVAALALGSLLAAVQLIPTYELVSHTQRAGGVSFEYASGYAYDLASFWTFVFPYLNGDIGDRTYTGSGIFWEEYGYVGFLTLLLALYGTVRSWKCWHVRFFAVVGAASYLLVLGPMTPVYRFAFSAVPGMSYFRFPTRLLLITDLSIIALAALGLSRLGARFVRPLGFRWASLIQASLVLVTVADLLYAQLRQNPIVDIGSWQKPPITATILAQDSSLFRVYCVGGVHAHRRTFEQANGWEGDLQPFVEQREFLQPSSNLLYGFASPNGYANLIPNYLVDVWGDQNRAGIIVRTASTRGEVFRPTQNFWKLMRMYNVKYLTSFWPFGPASNLTLLGVYGGAFLYRNDDLLPRAYLVGGVLPAADDVTALDLMLSDSFDPRRSVLLDAPPPRYVAGRGEVAGSADLVRYTANTAELKVQTQRDALLVFSDSYYPGWVADVDGRPTPIYRANVTQRAVAVPAGEHRVTFRFEPMSIAIGCGVSAASALVLLGWSLVSSRTVRERSGTFARPSLCTESPKP